MEFPNSSPIPGPHGPPASAQPIEDYRRSQPPGLTSDGRYLVLPAELLTGMELPWQQQLGALLEHYRRRHAHARWPSYTVTPTRPYVLTDLAEEQLAEVGVIAEYSEAGQLVYRHARTLEAIENPGETTVMVSCADPLAGPRPAPTSTRPSPPAPAPTESPRPGPTPTSR